MKNYRIIHFNRGHFIVQVQTVLIIVTVSSQSITSKTNPSAKEGNAHEKFNAFPIASERRHSSWPDICSKLSGWRGYETLFSNTTGLENTAFGSGSLYANTTGGVNAAIGYQALRDNSTGFGNTAGGGLSLRFNTTGFQNTATGNVSLYYNTTVYNNTANGFQAGDNNKSWKSVD
ncbi:hypothetical protein [Runella sp.]|uniref:hypothetical protein n=1 Tax=Runella sp. TaxID=1960881 RepID=UPI003D0D211D